MKSTLTLTDEVVIDSVQDLEEVKEALNSLFVRAEGFDPAGQVIHLSVDLRNNKDGGTSHHETYAQLVLKVGSDA